jgi:hypothetical protein
MIELWVTITLDKSLESLSFALYVKRETPGKENIYGIRR